MNNEIFERNEEKVLELSGGTSDEEKEELQRLERAAFMKGYEYAIQVLKDHIVLKL